MGLQNAEAAGSPADMLDHFESLYREKVRAAALDLLKVGDSGSRSWRRLLAPTTYTLGIRSNFFRAAFSLAAGEATDRPRHAAVAAAAGEIAWTCALMLDDLIDGSDEREGQPAAHVVHGRAATLRAVVLSLGVVMASGAGAREVPVASRLAMQRLGLKLLVECCLSQLPSRRRPASIDGFVRSARAVNNSTHWALVAPVAGGPSAVFELLWTYAEATSVNGKMRNDILDYCGGSTESVTLYGDFESRLPTFPVLVLLQSPLEATARRRVVRHFFAAGEPSDLTLEELMGLFRGARTLDRCLDLMRANAATAAAATERLGALGGPAEPLQELLRWWTAYLVDVAAERGALALA